MKSLPIGVAMGVMLLVTGIAHFIFPKPLDAIVPGFLPGDPRLYTYASGVAEIVIAIGLFMPTQFTFAGTPIKLIAAYAALALFIAVYPANIKMAIDWSSRPFSQALIAYARLPLQFGLFYWAWAIIKSLRALTPR